MLFLLRFLSRGFLFSRHHRLLIPRSYPPDDFCLSFSLPPTPRPFLRTKRRFDAGRSRSRCEFVFTCAQNNERLVCASRGEKVAFAETRSAKLCIFHPRDSEGTSVPIPRKSTRSDTTRLVRYFFFSSFLFFLRKAIMAFDPFVFAFIVSPGVRAARILSCGQNPKRP